MTLPPGVRYSILRNNTEVPLIPIDQLPFYIQGLPRELTPSRKYQEGWKLIGETHESTVPLSICVPPHMHSSWPSRLQDTNRHFLPPDHDARRGPVPVSQELKPLAESRLSSVGLARGVVNGLVSAPSGGQLAATKIEALAPAHSEGGLYPPYHPPNPSGVDPDPSKKEYCTHWIRTNSCDFIQQGCKYKHETPDLAKLNKLGFAETPKWYRDKIAILAGASSWLRPRANTDNDDRQLSIEPATSRALRPPVIGLRWNQPRAAALSGLPPPKAHRPPVEPPNLIDLDDYSMDTTSLTPSSSISSLPGTPSRIVKKGTKHLSEYITKTLAFSLRQERSDVDKITKTPNGTESAIRSEPLGQEKSDDTVSGVGAVPTEEISDSTAIAQTHSMSSDLSCNPGLDGVSNSSFKATKRVSSIAKSSTAMGSEAKRNRQSSKRQQRHNSRLWKLGDRPAHSTSALASPKHSTGQKPRKGDSTRKGPKRGEIQSEAKD